MSVWKTLSSINVNDKKQEKMGLSYLSWAWAWGELKSKYPSASYAIHDDIIYPDSTVEVRVTVTVEDQDHMMWLPVMDNRNRAISGPTSYDINKARMRCLAKAIAMHGLGHYIYAGEDIPQSEAVEDIPQSEGEPRREPVENKANLVVKRAEPQPTASPSAPESNLGYVVNTFAYRPQDKDPRAFSDWDTWVSIMCAWIDTAKTENQLNVFYNKNKKSFDLAKSDALSKYEEVISKLSAKKAEVQKGK